MSRKSRFQQVLEEAQRKYNELERERNKQDQLQDQLNDKVLNLESLIRKTQFILDDSELSESEKDEYLEQVSHYKETLAKYGQYRRIPFGSTFDNIIDSGYKSPAGGESLLFPEREGESRPSTGHRPHQISHKVMRKIGWVTKRIDNL